MSAARPAGFRQYRPAPYRSAPTHRRFWCAARSAEWRVGHRSSLLPHWHQMSHRRAPHRRLLSAVHRPCCAGLYRAHRLPFAPDRRPALAAPPRRAKHRPAHRATSRPIYRQYLAPSYHSAAIGQRALRPKFLHCESRPAPLYQCLHSIGRHAFAWHKRARHVLQTGPTPIWRPPARKSSAEK